MGARIDVADQGHEHHASASDAALAEQAAHAGRMLEAAYKAGDRELALIWQAAMYAMVNLRRARRFGLDTESNRQSQA